MNEVFSEDELKFYRERFPAIASKKWEPTGAKFFGAVWWRASIGIVQHQELRAAAAVGFVKGPTH